MPFPFYPDSNDIVQVSLHDWARNLGEKLGSDVFSFIGPLNFGADRLVNDLLTAPRPPDEQRQRKLSVVLQTPGGGLGVVERMVRSLRDHYAEIDFLIPDYAFSAGTIFALSGDRICMDEFAVLGPIDPQILVNDRWVPAIGYLRKYEELINKSGKEPLNAAEVAVVTSFDQALLYDIEEDCKNSIELITGWLSQYKFKNWVATETRKLPVTETLRKERASEIAERLNDHSLWHSHGRGIPRRVLSSDSGLNLKIDDIGPDNQTGMLVTNYHRLLLDYMGKIGAELGLHYEGMILLR